MRVYICGIDGYIGWALKHHLEAAGHVVGGCDNFSRRENVESVRSTSALPISEPHERGITYLDLGEHHEELKHELRVFQPDAVVHLAQQPSAPFSMKDYSTAQWTHRNNVEGNLSLLYALRQVCPSVHLVKLGTMGEYGTPDCEIPEGDFTVDFRGKTVTLPFPRQAGSWYHQTKVHDTHNVRFACKVWGLRATDIMQGVVYGTRIPSAPEVLTRFDFDECFGTVINRFCAQAAVGLPLSVYGGGHQTRGFLPLRDSVRCIELILAHPPIEGTYRTINQFAEAYSMNHLANVVAEVSGSAIEHVANPRVEAAEHFYQPEVRQLFEWGYEPSTDLRSDVIQIIEDLSGHVDRIREHVDAIRPKTQWVLEPERPGIEY